MKGRAKGGKGVETKPRGGEDKKYGPKEKKATKKAEGV